MDLNALKAAVTGAQNVTAPVINTNRTGANAFTQAAISHIDNLANLNASADASKVASNALYGGVSQQASIDASNAEAAHEQALAASKQKLSDLNDAVSELQDPSKYYRVQSNSGGWDYYAPNGKQISANDYATVKGQHVTDVVKGSQNTTDQEFLQDYKEVQDLGAAMQQGGTALQTYFKKNPGVQKQLQSQGLNNFGDVVKNFRASYPQYFPQSSVNDIGSASYNKTPLKPASSNIFSKLVSFLEQ